MYLVRGPPRSNSKHEIRISKQFLNDQKTQNSKQLVSGFHESDLSFSVCFGFNIRISAFGLFLTPPRHIGLKSNIQPYVSMKATVIS
jgi:hypothetical protein